MKNLKTDLIEQAILDEFGFKYVPFEMLSNKLAQKGYCTDSKPISGEILQPDVGELVSCENLEPAQSEYLSKLGQEAIEKGEVAVVVLNGGMATRFGGIPKGIVSVFANRSFLDYKLSQIEAISKGKALAVLMNSFATNLATLKHLEEIKVKNVLSFSQFVSVRLNKDGSIFTNAQNKLSFYAPGHGDFPYALKESGMLDKLLKNNVKYVTLSNVDNLGAALDPLIIGMHIKSQRAMSVELVRTEKGDVGGFPAKVNGKLVIMEAFRLPRNFNTDEINTFNTNTFVFNVDALSVPPLLDWFPVAKKVDGTEVVQFERLVGQMTEFVDVNWLIVQRYGNKSRFIPIKTVEDITIRESELKMRLKELDVL